jgi:transposase
MTIISAYQDAGSYRGAAAICGTTPKTVKRVIECAAAGGVRPPPKERVRNYEVVADLVAARVKKSAGRISAKRLLPAARMAGYEGSARNFRRLVAQAKRDWRVEHHRGRRPAIWSPGEHLVIDWGTQGGVHVFCAVLAWSRWRFVRFAADEQSTTTLAMLGERFAELGGVPQVVLADRMGCLKGGGVVANRVVPTGEYVRFAMHYGFRPDFCEAADPESKEIVENLVGYAKSESQTHRVVPHSSSLAYRAQHSCPDPDGVTTFHTHEMRPGRVPPVSRGRRYSPGRPEVLDRRLPLFHGSAPTPRSNNPSARLAITKHQRRFTRFTRPALPSPVAPMDGTGTLGLEP